MDNINIANDLWDCYWFIDDVFETNMHETIDDAMKNKFVGTFSSYADKSAMFKIANNLYNNKLGLACIGLKNYLTGKLKEFDMNSFVPDRLCDLIEKLRRIDAFYRMLNEYGEKFIDEYISELVADGYISSKDEISREEAAGIMFDIDKYDVGIDKDLKVCMLNDEPFEKDKPWKMSNTLVVSDNIYTLLNSITPTDDGFVHVNLMLKIEPVVDFSYFIIGLSNGKSMRYITDRISFKHPEQMFMTRSNHMSESRERTLPLPYMLIDEIISWRKNGTELARTGEEFYIKSLDSYVNGSYRILFMRFIENCIAKAERDDPVLMLPMREMVNDIKLLAGPETTAVPETEFGCKINRERLERWFDETFNYDCGDGVDACTDLVTLDTDLKAAGINSEALVTRDEALHTLGYYNAKKTAETAYSKRKEWMTDHMRDDLGLLIKMVYSKLDEFLKVWFSGDEVYMLDIDSCDTNTSSQFDKNYAHYYDCVKEKKYNPFYWGISDNYGCEHFGKVKKLKHNLLFTVNHWKLLCFMLGCERKDLPKTINSYYSHIFKPYEGNCILEDVDPRFVIEDPFSENHPNGITIPLNICGRCHAKAHKEYYIARKVCWLWSSKQMKLIKVNNMDIEDVKENLEYFLKDVK